MDVEPDALKFRGNFQPTFQKTFLFVSIVQFSRMMQKVGGETTAKLPNHTQASLRSEFHISTAQGLQKHGLMGFDQNGGKKKSLTLPTVVCRRPDASSAEGSER